MWVEWGKNVKHFLLSDTLNVIIYCIIVNSVGWTKRAAFEDATVGSDRHFVWGGVRHSIQSIYFEKYNKGIENSL